LHIFKLFFLLLATPLALFSDWSGVFPNEEDPSLFQHVHVISGQLTISLQDAVVRGASSFPLTRTYSSGSALEGGDLLLKDVRGGWLVEGGWNMLPHANLVVVHGKNRKKDVIHLAEPNGSILTYSYKETKGKALRYAVEKNGRKSISNARSNPENNLIEVYPQEKEVHLLLPDGGKRIYLEPKENSPSSGYRHLALEILPSQHKIFYTYDDQCRLEHIDLKNPSESKVYSWVHFNKKEAPSFSLEVKTSDGKYLRYSALLENDKGYLHQILSNCTKEEELSYTKAGSSFLVSNMKWEGERQFHAVYNSEGRVSKLEAPVGPNGEMVPIAEFSYERRFTDVKDSEGILTRYHHRKGLISEVEYFDRAETLHASVKFIWKNGALRAKVFCGSQGPIFSKTFKYDGRGNIIEEVLFGQITGSELSNFTLKKNGSLKGAERTVKKYVYEDTCNNLIYEEDGAVSYRYSYKEGTNLLSSKITSTKGQVQVREFFLYDDDHILVAEIIDDGIGKEAFDLRGVTERHIKRYEIDEDLGLMISMTELYFDPLLKKEVVLKSVRYSYNERCLVSSEAVYDSQQKYRYTLYTEYDDQGRVLYKTTPLGKECFYSYDAQGHLIKEKEAGSPLRSYSCDSVGRIYSSLEGEGREKFNTYDTKGRVLTRGDHTGTEIEQSYDSFGRCLQTKFKKTKDAKGETYQPSVSFTYDLQGNLSSYTGPNGDVTRTKYSVFRKPIQIKHPDGSQVVNTYNRKGSLTKTVYPDGTATENRYDLLERIKERRRLSASGKTLQKESWQYRGFHLLSYVDGRGVKTTFTYDGAGRKTLEETEGRRTFYEYDALGFLCKVTKGETAYVEQKDEEGRVLSKWEERGGVKERITNFSYNPEGFLEEGSCLEGKAIDFFTYDSEGKIRSHIDAFLAKTQFVYEEEIAEDGQVTLKKTTIDPLGNQIIEKSNGLGRIILREKRNSKGEVLSHEKLFYDRLGNLAKRVSGVYLEGVFLKDVTVAFEYDCLGRLSRQLEGEKKETIFSYDIMGRLSSKKLPSGTLLSYAYDELGRVVFLKSSDGSIHYTYEYGKGNDPVLFLDHVEKLSVKRVYNCAGEIIQETLPSGLVLFFSYDQEGHKKKITLPDGSSIFYEYASGHLHSVSRIDAQGNFQYKHVYSKYDQSGRVAEEEMICGLGLIKTTYDLLERPVEQISSFLSQSITYGISGLVTETKSTLLGDKTYEYDGLSQLKEKGLFDSTGNHTSYAVGDCNEVLSNLETKFSYDLDGNLVEKNGFGKKAIYTYDALGRLTSVTDEKRKIEYGYDPLSRLFIKKSKELNALKTELFFYEGGKEIGMADEDGKLQQVKVLGLGIGGEIGATVAIEVDGKVFAPLHDFSGNIIGLVSEKGQIADIYSMSPFGAVERESSEISPWRFGSKRHEGGLVFFGSRFYDVSLGRWLTPDPSGFAEGPNLYAYVLNNPLSRFDEFGLSSSDKDSFSLEIPISSIERSLGAEYLIECRGVVGGASMDCYVSCGFLHKLQYTPEEIKVGRVNLLDHFAELLPSSGRKIGLVTLSNGMNTTLDGFEEMGFSVASRISEGTLFIGMLTPSDGFFADLARSAMERGNYITPVIAQTAQFISAIIEKIHAINPDLLWLDIRHSEGGVIGRRAIEMLSPHERKILQRQMCSFTMGSAMPMPSDYGLHVHNVYSTADYFTGHFGVFMPSSYSIEIIPTAAHYSERVGWFVDHAFVGTTYQEALDTSIQSFRSFYGFHDENNR
jgi:RHS repeat-associated protein